MPTTVREVTKTNNVKRGDVIYEAKGPHPFKIYAEDTTCWTCACNDSCDYRYDPYNMHGDCLQLK